MMHCPACDLDYTGELNRCALCGTMLTGEPAPSPFPTVTVQRVSRRARFILSAITVVLLIAWVITCVALALPWLLGVAAAAALVLNYLFAWNVMLHSPNALRAIKRYFLVVMAMALLWFVATGNPIASSLVIPIISLAAILLDGILFAIMGSRMVTEYGKYLLYDIIFGAVPPVLILTDTVWWPTLAWSCVIVAAAMLVALLLFTRHSVADEARKLFSA